jgi:hypothetical protein
MFGLRQDCASIAQPWHLVLAERAALEKRVRTRANLLVKLSGGGYDGDRII